MLDSATKRRIDTARDILVGKVPDPKSQVEQITIALIYKFMDDMDAEAEEFGGERKFFAGEFAKFGWARLMHSGLGGHETLNLYAEAIQRMPENPGIPLLFRSIFNNAYLPYRDPETLRAFLKVIDEFEYDHSERLGDAFEYLLSVLGSQGDAGQFRTPRHIIEFIVDIVDPRKHETVLDPACGTAGFLISAYKHILAANTTISHMDGQDEQDKDDEFDMDIQDGQDFERDSDKNNILNILPIHVDSRSSTHVNLTPDERGKLAENFRGYDISPDMVRLSLVNMYLHGFADPHIDEYDTLTSEEKWNEYADLILANPPFMSPKGGIKPHNRFSVQSKRSEVLFVDYIAEHLTPNGRAGVIVPEGIIFQSQTAYKQLRKMLVEESLVAVVSLPSGVFNPYSGVKTSILILDKAAAKRNDTIGFFKVENDGFGLGAQRREIAQNDVPQVKAEIAEYLRRVRGGASLEDFAPSRGHIVAKDKIAANGDYNLSGERYLMGRGVRQHGWPTVLLGEVCTFMTGGTPSSSVAEYYEGGTVPWLVSGDIHKSVIRDCDKRITDAGVENSNAKYLPENSVLIALNGQGKTRGTVALLRMRGATCNQSLVAISPANPSEILSEYVFWVLKARYAEIRDLTGDDQRSGLNIPILKGIEIPLPSIDVQREIVAEIEGYQKVIDGARAVVENYRPHIPIDPTWPVVELGEVLTSVFSGVTPRGGKETYVDDGILFIRSQNVLSGRCDFSDAAFITPSTHVEMKRSSVQKDDVFLNITGASIGRSARMELAIEANVNQHVAVLRAKESLDPVFLSVFLNSDGGQHQIFAMQSGASREALNYAQIKQIRVPLPSRDVQQAIVKDIEAEQSAVESNRCLIERMEAKIAATLDRVWERNTNMYSLMN